jgi:hypothetical protein
VGSEQGVPRLRRTVQAGRQARLEQAALHGGQLLAQQRHVAVPAVGVQCPPGAPPGQLGIRRSRPSGASPTGVPCRMRAMRRDAAGHAGG